MLASNTIIQNRYRIVRQLGQGGMGTVYETIDERARCVAALKGTLALNDSEALRAFEREEALFANRGRPRRDAPTDIWTLVELQSSQSTAETRP